MTVICVEPYLRYFGRGHIGRGRIDIAPFPSPHIAISLLSSCALSCSSYGLYITATNLVNSPFRNHDTLGQRTGHFPFLFFFLISVCVYCPGVVIMLLYQHVEYIFGAGLIWFIFKGLLFYIK
jgi:hypothetical protein